MRLVPLDWIIVLASIVISFAPAVFLARRAGTSTAEFFTSGRAAPWWLIGVSMVATTFSTDTPNLVTNFVREGGVANNWQWWSFLLTGMATVFFYARLWRRSGMLTDLADTGEVLRVYRPQLEHTFIAVPPILSALVASVPVDRRDDVRPAANLFFKLGVDPPPCTSGFKDADRMRNPADLSPATPPAASYCKLPAAAHQVARGARNYPCPNGGTGATAAQCGLHFTPSAVPRAAVGAASVTGPAGGLFDTTGTVFLLQGSLPAPGTWQDLLKGLVS